ncbi:MAG: methyltransferase, TIGR04325 family [Candidatus Competibacteraceae bacterium]|nr:methyltransferase, TIGR04325 family [Candidatus Competibacteraceae bacterium]
MSHIDWLKKTQRSAFIRRWLPQGLRDMFNYLGGYAIYFRGEFTDWATARASAGGYDEETLLERLTTAAQAVKDGTAAWEQDGVTLDHIPDDPPLFAALARIALARGGQLSVLDFGGALGSSYFQCRGFLADATTLSWGVVEQPQLVAIGRERFERDALRFFGTIDEAVAALRPNVALFSSVLQYLEQPWTVLEQIIAAGTPYLIIDRHPCTFTHELITIQVIPPTLYPASYPSWLFDCPRMMARLEQHYELLATWEGKDPPIRGWGKGAEFRGYFLRRWEGI